MAKKDITGSVAVVGMRDILKAPVVNFDEALAGRLAGVSVSSADGTPGSDMNIVVRGANSLTQSNSPLYVIDGFPIENFSISAIGSLFAVLAWWGQMRIHSPQSMQRSEIIVALPWRTLIA